MADRREWLVTDGLGGCAMGSADGIRTRRYHAYLIVAAPRDERRFALVNDIELWVDTPEGAVALSSHRYMPNVVHPDGASRLVGFEAEPWPTWRFDLGNGLTIVQQLFAPRTTARAAMVLTWRAIGSGESATDLKLRARPLLSGRDFHALHRQNPDFRFQPEHVEKESWLWRPYTGVPPILLHANAKYQHEPLWFRNFSYVEERARGLDDVEDLASPGELTWTLGGSEGGDAVLMLTVPEEWGGYETAGNVVAECQALRNSERARIGAFRTRLHHSADEYLVRRGERDTIIAGYPWFTDWGRDTFIAVRGLCLEAGRLEEAERILLSWCATLSEGMMPNTFPTEGNEPRYNSVDASLWFVIAAQAFLDATARKGRWLDPTLARRLTDASQEILESYARGTRYGIRMDTDALLAAGEPGIALTWMDAIVDGQPITPRIGKPVEIQALWVNALVIGSRWNERWGDLADEASESFGERFWNARRGCLYDVVDVDHESGRQDDRIRPNQIMAVGGLRIALLAGDQARQVVDVVERELWTPMGLRTLARGEPEYATACAGPPASRDRAYHNGPAWPWLMGPFVDAWVRARAAGAGPFAAKAARADARRRFLGGLARHLDAAGIGHVSELADGDEPWTPRGCPFQAWSVSELLRLLAE
ncbi:MAG TPA: amylo-alpha-1,6-glucosidase [Gemmatimonadaceae bacterium]|nr:amylo-alpha-1,6-glucosidase [Gemmatimonadaceae bacterium]